MAIFTIIVPIYNAKNTIKRCLQSIKHQTCSDWEAYLIDDGSTDDSSVICQSYVQDDARFRQIQQQNKGPSVARNRGLECATGELIVFVDSDDCMDEKYLEQIYSRWMETKFDVVFIGYKKRRGKKEAEICIPKVTATEISRQVLELDQQECFGYTWCKVFTKEAIGTDRFCETIRISEDTLFTFQVLQKVKKLAILEQPLYEYTIENEDGLTKQSHENYCLVQNQLLQQWHGLLQETKQRQELKKLTKQAFDRCWYYGLERQVTPKTFYESFSQCERIMNVEEKDYRYWCIKHKKYGMLSFFRTWYQLRQKIASRK